MSFAALALAACRPLSVSQRRRDHRTGRDAPIDHIIVLFLENRSFDHLFGTYPGADGLDGYKGRQADRDGATYSKLPPPLGRDGKPDPRLPADLAERAVSSGRYLGPFDETNNPVHRFYHMQRQYGADADGVRDGQVGRGGDERRNHHGVLQPRGEPRCSGASPTSSCCSTAGSRSIHGGSFANHFYLISAAVARYPGRAATPSAQPASARTGESRRTARWTPDGWVVNNLDPPYPPQRTTHILKMPQTVPTIADRLDAAGITWAWYATGWGGAPMP